MKNKILALLALVTVFAGGVARAEKEFNICWSHYTGWEPWEYASHSGILKKWADKNKIKVKLTLVNDYVESINLYTSGKFQACVMTNMDALTIPAVGGIDSTALIVGDFSNGNDGIVIKNGATLADLKQRKTKLVQNSVSHYLLSRALAMNNIKEKDVPIVHASDADIGSIYVSDAKGSAVTWNPILMKIVQEKGSKLLFDSSKIPGEIIDLMVVRTDAPAELKKTLVGAWYETMQVMSATDKKGKEAISYMAKTAGSTDEEFRAQLKTTEMFYSPVKATEFSKGEQLKKTMDYVRTFSFDHGLYGERAKSKDLVGIAFPDGSILGDKGNVKLRFDATYMQQAAEGKL